MGTLCTLTALSAPPLVPSAPFALLPRAPAPLRLRLSTPPRLRALTLHPCTPLPLHRPCTAPAPRLHTHARRARTQVFGILSFLVGIAMIVFSSGIFYLEAPTTKECNEEAEVTGR